MNLLAGKTALVTGASRGIGVGIVKKFASEGANIAFTYLSSEEKAKALEAELSAMGIKAIGYKSDASNYTEAEDLINAIVADFGGLDIVVNNAGITKDGLLLRMGEEQWDSVIDTNLKSIFNITKHASRIMMKAKKGVFINMGSIVGLNGNAGQSNYSASKAGIVGFTKSIAKELGSRNIRSNVVAPGFIQTEMTGALDHGVTEQWSNLIPLKRPGSVDDVSNLCLFLASDMSSYITGQVYNVCGGLHM